VEHHVELEAFGPAEVEAEATEQKEA